MSKKLVLGNHLVPSIIAHLSKMTQLPPDGLLAGQSLCSAILDLYCGGGGVYNDIDVFRPASAEKLQELASDERKQADALALGIPVAQLDGYGQMNLESSDGIFMAGSEAEGLLNTIWCNVENDELTPGRLVYSFDLNAVEVALDLQHKELTWSKAFEEFLESRQLEITSLVTPERTLLRYLKKRHELGFFGQDELVLDMVATWMCNSETPAKAPVLTTKAFDLARQFKEQLKERFRITDGRLTVLFDWLPPEHLKESLDSRLNDSVAAVGVTRMTPSMWYAQSRAAAKSTETYAAEMVEYFDEATDCCGGVANVMHLAAAMQCGDYVRGQRSDTHRDTVLRVLDTHQGLNSALMGLTLDEQYRCVLDLAKRAKSQAGQLVYGLAETMATPVDMWNAHHREQFFRQMERETPGPTACEPYFSTFEEDGWQIRELCSRSALRAEGTRMNHCVGGYYSQVKNGYSRILAIRNVHNGKFASTAELTGKFGTGGHVSIAQHRTYKNGAPAAESKDALSRFLAAQSEKLGFTLGKKKSFFGDFEDVV
jgi:hypothetical protein